jgi:hypothetical protein
MKDNTALKDFPLKEQALKDLPLKEQEDIARRFYNESKRRGRPLNSFSAEPEYIREFLDVHKDEALRVIDGYARYIENAWPIC